MTITRIGGRNIEYFSHLTGGDIPAGQLGLGVIHEEEAAAAMLFSISEGTCIIEHLFVDPDHRRKGIASFLIKDAIEAFSDAGVDTVLVYYNGSEEITSFLLKMGFACKQSASCRAISFSRLVAAKRFKSLVQHKTSDNILYFDRLTS